MIPGFAHAEVGEPLADSAASTSWAVRQDGVHYVLRVDKPEARALGLERRTEGEIQAAVAHAGLTPPAVFHDGERGVSLRRRLIGRPWSAAELQQPANLERLAHVLRDLHALPPVGSLYEPGAAARRYAVHIGTAEAQRLADEANVLLAGLRFEPYRECLCHNDLVAENLIEAENRLVPIDWEYAGIGDRWFDLAVVVAHHDLSPELRATLVHSYLHREPRAAETARLEAWCRFYLMLLRLWTLRTARP